VCSLIGLSCCGELGVGDTFVHPRLSGQAEDAFADDVALDLVGAARQPVARRTEQVLGQSATA